MAMRERERVYFPYSKNTRQLLNKRIYDDDDDDEPYLAADTTNDTIRYFNVRSKADMSRFNLPHGNDN